MRHLFQLKVLLLFAFVTVSCWLFSTTLIINVEHVYYNQGDIQVLVVPSSMGNSASQSFAPTVYCCGTQIITWNQFPFYGCNATVIVTQGTRTISQYPVYIWGEALGANPTLTLALIPNFQHKDPK